MSNEHTQPEQTGAFTAGDLMRELAQVSGEKLDVVAPGLGDSPRLSERSAVDIALNEKTEQQMQASDALDLLAVSGSIFERIANNDPYIPPVLPDAKIFQELQRHLTGTMSPEIIADILDNQTELLDAIQKLDTTLSSGAIGAWLSVLVMAVPEPESPDVTVDIDMLLPGFLCGDPYYAQGLGSYMGGRRNLNIYGNPGDRLGAGMTGGAINVTGNAQTRTGIEMRGGQITISGNAGDNLGSNMVGGNIVVTGDCRDGVGWNMKDGSILVRGDVKQLTGYRMTLGTITIMGSASTQLGSNMAGGEINVYGDAGEAGYLMLGGTIKVAGEIQVIGNIPENSKANIIAGIAPDEKYVVRNGKLV